MEELRANVTREASPLELSELKDQLVLFKENVIWKHILAYMQAIYRDSAEEALQNPGDSIKCARASGRAEAVRFISEYETNIEALRRALKEGL